MTTVQQLVVGIFQDRSQAEQTIDELVRAGFDHHQIHFAGPGPEISTGGMLEKIKSLFTGQDVSAGWLYHDLENIGVPPEETRYYQQEFEAGRCIVAVQGGGGMQMVSLVMARHGGYGANQRAAQSADYNQRASAQEPNPNYGENQRVAQPADSNQRASAQEPNPNYGENQRVAQPTDSNQNAGPQEPTNEDENNEPLP